MDEFLWRGKPLNTLTREELLIALIQALKHVKMMEESARATAEFQALVTRVRKETFNGN